MPYLNSTRPTVLTPDPYHFLFWLLLRLADSVYEGPGVHPSVIRLGDERPLST